MKKLLFISLVAMAAISCNHSATPPNIASAPQYPLMGAVNATTTANSTDLNTMDLKTHAYSFTPTVTGTVSKLGYYFDNTTLNNADFTLSLWDLTSTAPIATTGQQTFTAGTQIVYFNISPVILNAGQTYYISRQYNTSSTTTGFASDYIGYLHICSPLFPLTVGSIYFNQSYFTDNPDPRTASPTAFGFNTYLPWIDFEFQ